MKKLLLLLSLVATLISYGQSSSSTVYDVYTTQFYTYNTVSKKWILQTEHQDVSITMVFYGNSINIQAKTPSLFRLKDETKEFISGDGFYGYRFEGLECVKGYACLVDYVYFNEDKTKFAISIVYDDNTLGKINLRYYSTLKNP